MGKTTMAIIWKSWVMKSRSLTGSLSVLAIFSVAFLVILASMSRSVNPYDEGIIATGATLVMAGEVMHRDFYANYGPAQFYILAILFKLFGPSILVARLWGALIKASIAVVVYLLGKRVMPTGWALVSCACSIVWLSLVENTVWPAWPALLATILSIFVLDTIFEKGSSFKRVFAAGMFVGIATLFRYDIGFIVCVAEAAVLLPFSFTVGTAGGQTRLRSVLVNLAATRSLPFPLPMPGRRPFYLSEYIVYFPLLMCLGVVFMAPFNRLHGSLAPRVATSAGDSRRGMWILLLLCAVTIGFFGKGLVRVSALHMTLAVVPATLILAAFLSANSHKKVSVGFAVFLGIAMVAGIIPTLNAYHTVTGKIANNLGHFSGRDRHDSAAQDAADTQVSCLPNPGLERIACFQLAIDHAAAVRYVQANTTVSDAIFVGLPQHERIFANNVGFYFVANRRPATKWYHFDPGLQTSQAIQELMISELLLSRPKFVVLDAEWEGWREPNESAKSSGVKLLDEFIDHHYVRVATFGSLSILQPLIADVPSR
jgi:Dolichyl-phosphate-mannose-protein mannosyltransferase